MTKIHGNGIALFRFLTPFPHLPPKLISEGQWGENRLLRLLDSKTPIFFPSDEKDARFQAPLSSPAERNRARSAFKRFFLPKSLRKREVLIFWGKSGVFSESTVLSFSYILGGRFHRLPSVDGS